MRVSPANKETATRLISLAAARPHALFRLHSGRISGGATVRIVLLLTAVVAVSAALLNWCVMRQQREAFHRRNACVGSLYRIYLAKRQVEQDLGLKRGDVVTADQLQEVGGLGTEVCPDGGVYVLNTVGADPQCSYTNTCCTWSVNWETRRLDVRHWKHTLAQ